MPAVSRAARGSASPGNRAASGVVRAASRASRSRCEGVSPAAHLVCQGAAVAAPVEILPAGTDQEVYPAAGILKCRVFLCISVRVMGDESGGRRIRDGTCHDDSRRFACPLRPSQYRFEGAAVGRHAYRSVGRLFAAGECCTCRCRIGDAPSGGVGFLDAVYVARSIRVGA